MWIVFILAGAFLGWVTFSDLRDESTDALFWNDCVWWEFTRTKHPWLYWVTVVVQGVTAVGLMAWGILSRFVF